MSITPTDIEQALMYRLAWLERNIESDDWWEKMSELWRVIAWLYQAIAYQETSQ